MPYLEQADLPKVVEQAKKVSKDLLGWVDMGGLVYFNICSGQHPLGMGKVKGDTTTTLPSQFITVENGMLRFTTALRIYLLAKTPRDIQEHGLCYFTPA